MPRFVVILFCEPRIVLRNGRCWMVQRAVYRISGHGHAENFSYQGLRVWVERVREARLYDFLVAQSGLQPPDGAAASLKCPTSLRLPSVAIRLQLTGGFKLSPAKNIRNTTSNLLWPKVLSYLFRQGNSVYLYLHYLSQCQTLKFFCGVNIFFPKNQLAVNASLFTRYMF